MGTREGNIKAKAMAVEDQAWAAWEEYLPEIERLAIEPPQTESDLKILRACANLVAGRIRMIQADREG